MYGEQCHGEWRRVIFELDTAHQDEIPQGVLLVDTCCIVLCNINKSIGNTNLDHFTCEVFGLRTIGRVN